MPTLSRSGLTDTFERIQSWTVAGRIRFLELALRYPPIRQASTARSS